MIARAQKLIKVRQTLTKMLMIRGYVVPAQPTAASFEEAYVKGEAELAFDATHKHTNAVLKVFFPCETDKTNLGIASIRNVLNAMELCTHAILVLHDSLTSPAVLMLRDLETRGIFISYFNENELLYDIYEHVRVPKHTLLTVDEKQELLRTLRATEDLLPKMQRQDPMARYLGLRVGDVVKIDRYSMTVGHDVYYRIVVDSEDFD